MNVLTFIRRLSYNSYPVWDASSTKYSIEDEHITLLPQARIKFYWKQTQPYSDGFRAHTNRPRNKCNLRANLGYKK